MKEYKDGNWNLDSCESTLESCSLAVLMDIRRELKELNRLLRCPNFMTIPRKLDRISANTYRAKKRKQKTKTAKGELHGSKTRI